MQAFAYIPTKWIKQRKATETREETCTTDKSIVYVKLSIRIEIGLLPKRSYSDDDDDDDDD